MTVKAALRSIVLALIAITGISGYAVIKFGQWLYIEQMRREELAAEVHGTTPPHWQHPRTKQWHNEPLGQHG